MEDVRYTRRAVSVTVSGGWFSGVSFNLISIPLSVGASLSILSLLSTVFPASPVPGRAGAVDIVRDVSIGAASATAASILTYPLDTLRRRSIVGSPVRTSLLSGLPVHLARVSLESSLLIALYLVSIRCPSPWPPLVLREWNRLVLNIFV